MKTERQKLEQEVKTWSGSTNRFRMERDDLAERNADLKRQLNLDSTNLKQAEYQNQKLKQELSTYKLAFEKLESEIVIAKNKEQSDLPSSGIELDIFMILISLPDLENLIEV